MFTISDQLSQLSVATALIAADGTVTHPSRGFLRLFSIAPESCTYLNIGHTKQLRMLAPCLDTFLATAADAPCPTVISQTLDSSSEPTLVFCLLTTAHQNHGDLQQLFCFDITSLRQIEQGYQQKINDYQERVKALEAKIKISTSSLNDTTGSLSTEASKPHAALFTNQVNESRFRALTETTSDFIWEINRAGNYTYASPKIKDLLGLDPAELIGQKFLLFQNPETESSVLQKIGANEDDASGFSGMISNHTDQKGTTVIIESSGAAIFSDKGELVGFRGIDRDITDRVGRQDRLRQAKEHAEAASAAKSEFLANMSHELRTPLHAILSFSKHGMKTAETSDSVAMKNFFSQISVSANRLLPLINSLLDLSKLESGKATYAFKNTDIATEILSCIAEFSQLAEQQELTIIYTPEKKPHRAFFDTAKIAQVLRNILGNALKFSKPGTVVGITTRDNRVDSKDYLTVRIKNSGCGIPQEELENVFAPFFQSSVTKSGAGGSGLGLSISKKIIEDHQGTMWAESPDHETTVFSFTLPKKPQPKKLGQILIEKGLVSHEDVQQALQDQR